MRIQKRNFITYFLLNCLTLGIYGFVVGMQIDHEINALCKGDKERPACGYAATAFIRLLAPVYYTYWWYKQNDRLRANAWRYDMVVKEKGSDHFLLRTGCEVLLLPFTLLVYLCAMLIPLLIAWLIFLISSSIGVAIVLAGIALFVLLLFSGELSAGALISMYYTMKNLNRFADVSISSGKPFDPMGYSYYPSAQNFSMPMQVFAAEPKGRITEPAKPAGVNPQENPETNLLHGGCITGLKGSCRGYRFDVAGREEIVIGKDAKFSSVVIDPAYKQVSRKHVGIRYDAARDVYIVVDYSSNGTFANGVKLTPGVESLQYHGTILKLADDKNQFRLE